MSNQKIDADRIREKIDQFYEQTHKLPSVRELRAALGNVGSTCVLARELRDKRSSLQEPEIEQADPEVFNAALATVLTDTTQTLKLALGNAVQKAREQYEQKATQAIEYAQQQADEIAHENELLNQRLEELRLTFKQQTDCLNSTLVTVGQLQEFKATAREENRQLQAKLENLQIQLATCKSQLQALQNKKAKKKPSNVTANET